MANETDKTYKVVRQMTSNGNIRRFIMGSGLSFVKAQALVRRCARRFGKRNNSFLIFQENDTGFNA